MSQCACNATYSGMENITIKETGKVKKVKDEEVNGQGGKRRERGHRAYVGLVLCTSTKLLCIESSLVDCLWIYHLG